MGDNGQTPPPPGVYSYVAGGIMPAGDYPQALPALDEELRQAEINLIKEATTALTGNYVDPEDALRGADGRKWDLLGAADQTLSSVIRTEAQLTEVRNECRMLAIGNPYAINAHENRINYIVGTGHQYRVVSKKHVEASDEQVAKVQAVLDGFTDANRWQRRQAEIVRRKDRDGECFLRLFPQADGTTSVRFVEPKQVASPRSPHNTSLRMGIQFDADDAEIPVAYIIDGESVDAAAIQHRKANVDSNVPRGLPLFYSVKKELEKIERIDRNMAAVTGIQSAIAIIKRHKSGTQAGIKSKATGDADASVTNTRTGSTTYHKRFDPGTILDALQDTEYDFPSMRVKPDSFVPVCEHLLRGVASRLVLPEFMLTSNARNSNYASTMVAEGPAVKQFERMQGDLIEEDIELLDKVLAHAVSAGLLEQEAVDATMIAATAPMLATRDRLKEVQADEVLVRNGAMSDQTMAERSGLDWDNEQERLDQSADRQDPYAGQGFSPGQLPGGDGDNAEESIQTRAMASLLKEVQRACVTMAGMGQRMTEAIHHADGTTSTVKLED